MRINDITEGIHDPNQKKAVFLLGGPGSGKSTIAKKLFSHSGMKIVNVDHFYEMLTKKLNLAGDYTDEIYDTAYIKNNKRLELFLRENLGVVIDGTGRDVEKIKLLYLKLHKLGYDIASVFVNTNLETALSRNETRPRKVDPDLLKQMHKDASENLGEFQKLFKDKMLIIDNNNDLQLDYAFKKINNFINTPR
jgi:predicted kinase